MLQKKTKKKKVGVVQAITIARPFLKTYLAPQWRKIVILAVSMLATTGLGLLGPWLLGYFIDSAISKVALQTLFLIALLYLCSAFAARGVQVVEGFLAGQIAWLTTNALRIDVARHCLHLDFSFHEQHTPGELIERIDGDVGMLNNLFSRFILVILTNAFNIISVLIVLYFIDLRIGLVLLAYSGIFLLLNIRLMGISTPYFVAARQAEAELSGFLEERIEGTESVRANGAVGYILRRLTHFLQQRLRTQRRAAIVSSSVGSFRMVLYAIGTILALTFAGVLYLQHSIPIGIAYLVYSYTMKLWEPLRDLARHFGDFQQAIAGLLRLQDLLDTKSVVVDGECTQLPAGPLAVEFDNVSFHYQTGEPVLQDISFQLAPGKVLGILGHTGSGKTTLTRLLLRFYDPQHGVIRLNGVDLPSLKLDMVRSRIALVTQDVQLFHATVRDNITFFDDTIADAAILTAFDTLGLQNWYRSLPEGLNTMLSANSSSLSAGQAQLLALTRVFLRQPDLVVLDEASSRLDPATEALLDRALVGLLQDRTVIIIAHRLTTVKRVDEMLVLDQGRISEHGSRQQLQADPHSRYAGLLLTTNPEVST